MRVNSPDISWMAKTYSITFLVRFRTNRKRHGRCLVPMYPDFTAMWGNQRCPTPKLDEEPTRSTLGRRSRVHSEEDVTNGPMAHHFHKTHELTHCYGFQHLIRFVYRFTADPECGQLQSKTRLWNASKKIGTIAKLSLATSLSTSQKVQIKPPQKWQLGKQGYIHTDPFCDQRI